MYFTISLLIPIQIFQFMLNEFNNFCLFVYKYHLLNNWQEEFYAIFTWRYQVLFVKYITKNYNILHIKLNKHCEINPNRIYDRKICDINYSTQHINDTNGNKAYDFQYKPDFQFTSKIINIQLKKTTHGNILGKNDRANQLSDPASAFSSDRLDLSTFWQTADAFIYLQNEIISKIGMYSTACFFAKRVGGSVVFPRRGRLWSTMSRGHTRRLFEFYKLFMFCVCAVNICEPSRSGSCIWRRVARGKMRFFFAWFIVDVLKS